MAPPCVSVRAVRAVHSVWHVCVGGMCVQVYEGAVMELAGTVRSNSQGCLAEQRAMAVSHVAGRVFTLAGHVTGQLPGRTGWHR